MERKGACVADNARARVSRGEGGGPPAEAGGRGQGEVKGGFGSQLSPTPLAWGEDGYGQFVGPQETGGC